MVKSNTPKRIYDYIVDYTTKHLYPPTIKDIQEHTGIKSSSAVKYQLDKLCTLGVIEQEIGQARAIKLIGYKLIKENRG